MRYEGIPMELILDPFTGADFVEVNDFIGRIVVEAELKGKALRLKLEQVKSHTLPVPGQQKENAMQEPGVMERLKELEDFRDQLVGNVEKAKDEFRHGPHTGAEDAAFGAALDALIPKTEPKPGWIKDAKGLGWQEWRKGKYFLIHFDKNPGPQGWRLYLSGGAIIQGPYSETPPWEAFAWADQIIAAREKIEPKKRTAWPIGAKFKSKDNLTECILAQVDYGMANIIVTKGWDKGNRMCKSWPIIDHSAIELPADFLAEATPIEEKSA